MAALLCVPAFARSSRADEPPASPPSTAPAEKKVSPLGVRQQRVEQMMDDLDRTFKSLAASLEKTEPERAARLLQALEESKQLLIQRRMANIASLLNDTQLDTATAEQKVILADLEKLLAILLRDEQADKDLEEAARLERWKRELEKVLLEQRAHRLESGKVANKENTLATLAARLAQLREIIKQQQAVVEQTRQNLDKAGRPLTATADAQQRVREQTGKLLQEIAPAPPGTAAEAPAGGAPQESPASKPAPAAAPSAQAGAAEAGQQPLGQAMGRQSQAEQELGLGKVRAALAEEEQAVRHLEEALAELEQERSRIASLPKEHSQELARRQEATARRTAQLESQMKAPAPAAGKSPAGGSQGDGKAEGSGAKPPPGKAQVQSAQQAMQQASGDLQEDDPAGAAQQQDQAVRKLEEALREIEKRLAQLREQMQMDKLARLETRFREILERQQQVTPVTPKIESHRAADGTLPRADRLQLARLAAEEKSLAEATHLALEIIVEDGTSVVFPEIVAHLHADLVQAGEWLAAHRTDKSTQQLQTDIEVTLVELLDALKKSQQNKKAGGGGGGGGGGGNEPLLPSSAELKLLRSSQLRINGRTPALHAALAANSQAKAEAARHELADLARRQEEIASLAERLLRRP